MNDNEILETSSGEHKRCRLLSGDYVFDNKDGREEKKFKADDAESLQAIIDEQLDIIAQYERYKAEIRQKEAALIERDATIAQYYVKIGEIETEIGQFKTQIVEYKQEISRVNSENDTRKNQIDQKEEECTQITAQIIQTDAQQKQIEAEINQIKSQRDKAAKERDSAARDRDNAVRDRDNAARERDNAARERDNAARDRDRIRRLYENKLRDSITALVRRDSDFPVIKQRTQDADVSIEVHEGAEESDKSFALTTSNLLLPEDISNDITSALMVRFSQLRNGNFVCSTKGDVSTILHLALGDAVAIVNAKIKLVHGNLDHCRLEVRHEFEIFSNKVVHLVVIESISGCPILVVNAEDPIQADLGKVSSAIAGKIFDSLWFMAFAGHPAPFVMSTTFNQTRVAWLEEDKDAQILAADGQRWDDQNLKSKIDHITRAERKQPGSPQSVGNPKIATATERTVIGPPSPPDDSSSALELTCTNIQPVRRTVSASLHFEKVERKICVSKCYGNAMLVPVACHALACALDVYEDAANFANNLHANIPTGVQLIAREVIMLVDTDGRKDEAKGYDLGKVTVTVSGDRATRSDCFYLLAVLGTGRTSKAFLALDAVGCLCVVKMYVKRYIGKECLDEKEFMVLAKKAVDREVQNYKLVYDQELSDCVWAQQLNHHWCVVMPYFRPLSSEKERQGFLKNGSIELALEKIAEKKIGHSPSERSWRHIGMWAPTVNGPLKPMIFDLADLQKLDDSREYVKDHLAVLQSSVNDQA